MLSPASQLLETVHASMLRSLLDYFGNAAGYTPLLSLAGTVKLYAEETRRALRMQLLMEWITAKERDTKALASALTTTIDNLNDETKAAAERITTAEAAIAKAMHDLDALEQELEGLSYQLDALRNHLLAKARDDENRKAQVRFAIRIGAALCQVIPVGQPVLGTLGSAGRRGLGIRRRRWLQGAGYGVEDGRHHHQGPHGGKESRGSQEEGRKGKSQGKAGRK
jgi:hypothetical protein